MIYVSLGVDCGVANTIKKLGKRTCSLPFDWVVTYAGVSNVVKNEFKEYLDVETVKPNIYYNEKYNVLFVHNHFPNDHEMMTKRGERFISMLKETTEKVIFVRKTHAKHHHAEIAMYGTDFSIDKSLVLNDFEDIKEFDLFLKSTYPNLNYEIHFILSCDVCHKQKTFENNSNTIIIHDLINNSGFNPIDDNDLLKYMLKLFK